MADFEHEHRVAVEAVRRASKVCRSVQLKIDRGMLEKKDKSPVTVADYGSQALICDSLLQAFPEDPVVAEEDSVSLRTPEGHSILARVVSELAGELASEHATLAAIDRGGSDCAEGRRWTLDPVDGTKGFLRGGQYAVALALLIDGEIEVGALACPNLPLDAGPNAPGVIFSAVRGGGAFAEPLFVPGARKPIRVSSGGDATRVRVCESVESGHTAQDHTQRILQELGVSASPVRLDSQAKYGLVASAEAEIYLRLPTSATYREKIWDHAAGALVVLEAGGRVSDIHGRALDFTRGRELTENRGVVVSHGPLHDRILEVIARAKPN